MRRREPNSFQNRIPSLFLSRSRCYPPRLRRFACRSPHREFNVAAPVACPEFPRLPPGQRLPRGLRCCHIVIVVLLSRPRHQPATMRDLAQFDHETFTAKGTFGAPPAHRRFCPPQPSPQDANGRTSLPPWHSGNLSWQRFRASHPIRCSQHRHEIFYAAFGSITASW